MLRATSLICPSEIKKFQNVSLSRTTVQRRVEDIAENITEQVCHKVMEFSYYSLAIDGSTDSTYMAQLLVFVRGIDDNFNVSEELAGMQSMQGRTTGNDICSAIIDCVTKKLFSDFKNLVGLCADGAPAMCGKTNKKWLSYKSTLEERLSLITALYNGKFLKFDHVMLVVVSIVNSLRTRKLKHRLF